MLKLLYELTGRPLVDEVKNLAASRSRDHRILVVVGNPLIFAALRQFGARDLPAGVKLLESADKVHIFESRDPILVVDVDPEVPTFRKRHLPPSESALMGSVARAVMVSLEHFNALHFVDGFDGPVVSALRQIAKSQGVVQFVEAVSAHIEHCKEPGDQPQDAVAWMRDGFSPLGRKGASVGDPIAGALADQSVTLVGFLDRVRQSPDPHTYIKALLSYVSYIKSNKNASKASRELKISRTTLHDHLRVASELQIADQLDSRQGMMLLGLKA